MKVWVVQISEELPVDSGSPRLQRTGLLARELRARGHDVVYWASTFRYRARTFRAQDSVSVEVEPGFTLRLLHGGGYWRNISLQRIAYHRRIARRFMEAIAREGAPDLIFCSYPTLELSEAAVSYGGKHGVPVVLDVRDMWPDIFERLVPRWTGFAGRRLAAAALAPMVRQAQRAFRGARAITGITAPMVDWGLAYAERDATALDAHFPHAYSRRALGEGAREAARCTLAERGIDLSAAEFRIVFFGLFARAPEFETVLAAAGKLASDGVPVRFILCGNGPREDEVRRQASRLPNVTVPGWLDGDAIWSLMEASHAGLLCYHSTFDFEASIPNKPIEYLAGGLPVLSSLERGVLKDLLEREGCGFSYRNGRPDELAGHVRRLASDLSLREELCRNARRVFDEQFDASRVYSQFAEHLENVANA